MAQAQLISEPQESVNQRIMQATEEEKTMLKQAAGSREGEIQNELDANILQNRTQLEEASSWQTGSRYSSGQQSTDPHPHLHCGENCSRKWPVTLGHYDQQKEQRVAEGNFNHRGWSSTAECHHSTGRQSSLAE